MSLKQFLSDDAKKKCTEIIKEIEGQTSAEIVIAARASSSRYGEADWQIGIIFMLLVTAVLLAVPYVFNPFHIVLTCLVSCVAGKMLARLLTPLRRKMIPAQIQSDAVLLRAQSRFVELGVTRTSRRNGILFFISLFERRVVVLPDIGVDEEFLGEPWRESKAELERAVAALDFDAFSAAMKKFGPLLGAAMPRADDDVNELPDEVQ